MGWTLLRIKELGFFMRFLNYLYALQFIIKKTLVFLVNLRSANCNAIEISHRA